MNLYYKQEEKIMKKEKIKVLIILILLVILVILSVILTNKNSNNSINEKIGKQSEDDIYKEVLTEVLYGEEKYVTHDENGNRVNKSSEMSKTVTIDGINDLEIRGIKITSKDNNTNISGTVTNVGSLTFDGDSITIFLKDEEKKEILNVGVYINAINPGETITFQTSVTMDLANAYSYTASK